MITHYVEASHVLEVIKSFLDMNKGDEATERLLVAIGCEIFDVSDDMMIDELCF